MHFSPLVDTLIDSLRCLPGVGPKSAQRMAFYLLERARVPGQALARSLAQALEEVGHCQRCRLFAETAECRFCQDQQRDRQQLCIVEGPADVLAVEQAGYFRGLYFVLMGHLSPIDGIGPEALGLDALSGRFNTENFEEIIIATNPTVEGETTAYYIAEMARKRNIKVSRIAHGVPLGGELEMVNSHTLLEAFSARREMKTVS